MFLFYYQAHILMLMHLRFYIILLHLPYFGKFVKNHNHHLSRLFFVVCRLSKNQAVLLILLLVMQNNIFSHILLFFFLNSLSVKDQNLKKYQKHTKQALAQKGLEFQFFSLKNITKILQKREG